MAVALVSALFQGTNPIENKAHEIAPCPALIFEDSYSLDDEIIKGIDVNRKK